MFMVKMRKKPCKNAVSYTHLDVYKRQSEFFGGAPIIQVEGRTYPVDFHYLPPLHDDEELLSLIHI